MRLHHLPDARVGKPDGDAGPRLLLLLQPAEPPVQQHLEQRHEVARRLGQRADAVKVRCHGVDAGRGARAYCRLERVQRLPRRRRHDGPDRLAAERRGRKARRHGDCGARRRAAGGLEHVCELSGIARQSRGERGGGTRTEWPRMVSPSSMFPT
jgi:hypothetical protein